MKKQLWFRRLLKSWCVLLTIYLFTMFNNVFSYQIRYIARDKADLGNDTIPDLVYRKHVNSYDPTPTNGWVTRADKGSTFTDQFLGINNSSHNNKDSFERYYEYFHPYQNSNYNLDNSDGGKLMERYFSTYTVEMNSWLTSDPPASEFTVNRPYTTLYNVWGETGSYQGIYDGPVTSTSIPNLRSDFTANENIYIMTSNWYRYAVEKGVWLSDNGLTKETVKKLWKKFGTTNVDESGNNLNIYNSSVLRTSSKNGLYYQNMDTAYKVWQTLLYGKNKGNWHNSPSTVGKGWPNAKGYRALESIRSVINYYDNTLVVPMTGEINIYVRHIDITNASSINATTIDGCPRMTDVQNPMAISVLNSDWNYNEGWVAQDTSMPWREWYLETYKKEPAETQSPWRLANIKYNSETAGSYWNNCLSENQRTSYKDYTCVGAIVGKGDEMVIAEDSIKSMLNTQGNVLINNSIPAPYVPDAIETNTANGKGTGQIVKNSDSTSVIVTQNEKYQYVVIDFYYKKTTPGGGGGTSSKNKVYVRHIDITNKEPLSATKADNSARLPGRGVAEVITNWSTTNRNSLIPISGYEEMYEVSPGENLRVDNAQVEGYSCVGTNMVYSNNTEQDAANVFNIVKGKMDTLLNSYNKYDDDITNSRTADGGNAVTIIDFYYKSEYGGSVIERDEVGHLSYYTLNPDGSDIFSSSVNNRENDYIPSNNELRLSVDDAYTFMLGAINIQEQKIQETTTFTYTIKQKYTVTFNHYETSCSCGEYSDAYESGYHVSPTTCGEDDEDCEEDPGCEWGTPTETTATEEHSTTISYSYSIPHQYTFYKVKNMRVYTISKLELLDGYNNWGLPLFDGKTHIVEPTASYKNAFTDSNNFVTSSDNETLLLSGKEYTDTQVGVDLSSIPIQESTTTLAYDYTSDGTYTSKSSGDSTTSPKGATEVTTLYNNNVTASKAAKFKGIDNNGVVTYSDDSIKLRLRVNNDKYYFKDPVRNSETIIIGDSSKSTGNPTNTNAEKNYIDLYKSNEYQAIKDVDLHEYTKVSNNTTNILVSTKYPNDVQNKYEPEDDYKTGYKYFNVTPKNEDKNLTIPKYRVNGKRFSYGTILYELLGYGVLSFDTSNAPNNTHSFTKKSTIGDTFADTEMNKKNAVDEVGTKTLITNSSLRPIKWKYGENNSSSSDIDVVNVFTPVAFSTKVLNESTNQIINHSNKQLINQIQKNAEFSINMQTEPHTIYSRLSDTNEYVDSYYIKFDFDVQNIKIIDAKAKQENPVGSQVRSYFPSYIAAGTWIGPIYNEYNDVNYGSVTIKGFAKADPHETLSVVNQETNSYWVRGVANNAPSSLKQSLKSGQLSVVNASEFIDEYISSSAENVLISSGTSMRHYPTYYTQKNIISDSNFVAEAAEETENISRVYDFKVTDVKDIDWKNIFRKTTSTQTNVHSSNAYYSGIYKWNIYTTANNDIIARSSSEIGSTKVQTLPVGPHKHTNSTYVNAPKLGYRFSFDLKTTGENENKKIIIEPEFYYISKDGKTYIDSNHIKLFYRNSSNKYVDISKYDLYFVPNDGYRLTFEGTDAAYRFHESGSVLSTSTLKLGNTKQITLTSKMKEDSDNGFVQIWYGEYKLPNSTIAVKLDGYGDYDINTDRLTNGYIGVKFNIRVEEYSGSNLKRTVYYGEDNTNLSSGGSNNTSQWDYEGFLGYTYKNSNIASLRIPLEHGSFMISDGVYENIAGGYWSAEELYDDIKGTVILYDIDARASDDYN